MVVYMGHGLNTVWCAVLGQVSISLELSIFVLPPSLLLLHSLPFIVI
jgi:hypothetical protein